MKNSSVFNGCSLVTGGAGFIGPHLIARLLQNGEKVMAVDNFSRGSAVHLSTFMSHPMFRVISANLAIRNDCMRVFDVAESFGGVREVWHLAANSDIPAGIDNPDVDLRDTFLSTFELLHACHHYQVKFFHFASSSAIYGDLGSNLLYESTGPLLPISNYGAMKLASEAQISAASEVFLERANIFRFPNVVGRPATHGIILDLINKLQKSPSILHVLGDGSQQKPYLHVSDLIAAMLIIRDATSLNKVEVVNIGPSDAGITVKQIAEQVVSRVSPGALIVYGDENRGWVGDVPKFNYSTKKLQSYGWRPQLSSMRAIKCAIDEIAFDLCL